LEYLEIEPFCFALRLTLHYRRNRITTENALIVCSCNVLSLGCSAECGRCARTINKIIKDALGACARECAANCPHSAHHVEVPAGVPVTQVPAA
jgi:bacterioferritin-associated ferredoxin